MLAKLTSKNQITLPDSVTQAMGQAEYFEVEVQSGQLILTPVQTHGADAVRAKLADLNINEQDVTEAVQWAREL